MRNVQKVGIKPMTNLLSEITRDYIYLPMHGITHGDDSATAVSERAQGTTISWRLSNQTVDTPNANTYTASPGMVKPDATHMLLLGDPNTDELLNRIFNQAVVGAADGITLVGFTMLMHTTAPTTAEEIFDCPTSYPGTDGLFGIQALNSSTNVAIRPTWKNKDGTAIFTPSKAFAPGTEHQITFAFDHYNGLIRLFSDGDYAAPVDVSMPTDGTALPTFISTTRICMFGRKSGASTATNLFNAGTSSSANAAIHDFFACRIAGADATVVADVVREAHANRYALPVKALAS